SGCASTPSLDEMREAAGTSWELTFEGNEQLSADTLVEEAHAEIEPLYTKEPKFRKADVDDLAFEVERIYRTHGYHFARVDYDYAATAEGGAVGLFGGPRVLLKGLVFEGNRAVDSETLGPLLADRRTWILGLGDRLFVASDVDALADAVLDAYVSRGFL